MIWLVPSCGGLDLSEHRNMGFIIQPGGGRISSVQRYAFPFAIDNGAFGGKFDPGKYLALLSAAEPYRDRCLFVVAPDVVADARATQQRWAEWLPALRGFGYPVAYVAQDGIDEPPWAELDALFIGGTTEFKLSDQAMVLLRAAGRRGKWRHVGRINSHKRLRHFWGNADSFDGTDWCRGPLIKLPFYQKAMTLASLQTRMDLSASPGRG